MSVPADVRAAPVATVAAVTARRASIVLLAAVALVAAGCGTSAKERRRNAVDAYFQQVNSIQARHARGFREANRAFGAVRGTDRATPAQLRRAVRTVDAARAAVARLDPPPDARAIHRDLLLLYARQAGLAREVVRLRAFVPAARRALRGLGGVNARFRRDVGGGPSAADEAVALRAYSARLRPLVARLRALGAPPALVPWRDDQAQRLGALATTSATLARALEASDLVATRALAKRLRLQLAEQSATSDAQRAAVLAYDRRIRAVATLARRIDRERAALERALG